MSILITGGSGFLGKHLQSALRLRSNVVAPSSKELNLLDFQNTQEFFRDNDFNTVIHCAGFVGGIGLNVDQWSHMYSKNLLMGMHLIEALENRPTHLVFISTICVYPDNAKTPTPENQMFSGMPAKATAAYGLAKRRLLSVLQQSGVKYTYLIPTNLYGPGDHFEEHRSHVVPAIIRRAHEAKINEKPFLEVWGAPEVTRDLLYVEDVCTAILKAAFSTPQRQVYNLSSGVETSIGCLAKLAAVTAEYWGDIRYTAGKPTGAWQRFLDGRKFNEKFDWQPKVSLETGIQQTYKWYVDSIRSR